MVVSPSDHQLTGEEQRQIVTPYAFGVSEALIGIPLASPKRRAMAILIDLILVSLLTNVSSLLLGLLAAVAFWKAGNKNKTNRRFPLLRKLLRVMAAMLFFVVAIGLVEGLKPKLNQREGNADKATLNQVVTVGAYLLKGKALAAKIDSGECLPALQCWQTFMHELGEQIGKQPVSESKASALMKDVVEQMPENINKQQRQELLQSLQSSFRDYRRQHPLSQAAVEPDAGKAKQLIPRNEDGDPSVLAWIKGIVGDLGIGFGWAALYFTAFNAWWRGRTPGKRLLGMQIIKLNGQPMSWWESFERYGGYSAGFATGLLGFLQVYWDPNRQAIHDKIAGTLVINGQLSPAQSANVALAAQTNEDGSND